MTLLAFALARGSVAKVLQAVSCISDHLEMQYRAASLIVSMATVRLRLLNRNGNLTHNLLLSFTLRYLKPETSERKCLVCNGKTISGLYSRNLLTLLQSSSCPSEK